MAVFALHARADGLRSVPFYRFGVTGDYLGGANLVLADITGDARPEIISCSNGAPFALGYSGGTYVPVWHGPNVGCRAVTAGDADGDGATDVIVVNGTSSAGNSSSDGGQIRVFDPRGFGAPRRTVALPGNEGPTDVAFGNVDFDAAPEIVVTTAGATHVFDARSLALQWSAIGYGGTDLKLGDIDGDARLEIVTNDESFAAVLDGGTQVVKWGYAGGFGLNMSIGNVDADPKAEIVFPYGHDHYTDLEILNGDFTFSKLPYTGLPVGIGDANGDGVNEVIISGGTMTGVRPSDGTVLWTSAFPQNSGGMFGDAAVGDTDGDGKPELVYGAGTASSRNVLAVADVVSHTIEHEGVDLDYDLQSATGDVDRDGRADLVIASTTSDNGSNGGIVQIVDPRTHAVKGTLSRTGLQFFDINRIAIGQLDADPALEIVALCLNSNDPTLVVWDGVTHQIEWQSAPSQSPAFTPTDMAVGNVDGDPVDEIVLGRSDGKLVVLNGASSVIQASKTLSGNLVSIALADVDHDGNLEAVAGTSTTLYLLDAADWSVIQQAPLPFIKSVAATSAGGGRIAVTYVSQSFSVNVRLYDLSLTASWSCGLPSGNYYPDQSAVVFADAGGATRLVVGTETGALAVFPLTGGPGCPSSTTLASSPTSVFDLHSVDVTGDGRPELVVDGWHSVEVDLIALSTQLRGDVDGDGSIGPQDVDVLADTLFGATPGILPMADVNADECVSPEDVFALIDYEYAGGPEPQP